MGQGTKTHIVAVIWLMTLLPVGADTPHVAPAPGPGIQLTEMNRIDRNDPNYRPSQ